jgi:hypothetical protein
VGGVLLWPVVSLAEGIAPLELDLGSLKLSVYVSETATTFHVVDQLTEWSEFCHHQYAAFFKREGGGLTDKDQEVMAKHRAIRGQLPWGVGLEQTFYTPVSLEAALDAGVRAGHISAEQATVEREVLTYFAPRAAELLQKESATLMRFEERLKQEQKPIAEQAAVFARFVGVSKIEVPVYLIANPDDSNCGGGYNGGRLTLEIPRVYDVYPIFLHEVMHAFLEVRKPDIQRAAGNVNGLDLETLSEGLAYAFSPGILHAEGKGDPLADDVRQDDANGTDLSDSYTRFHRFGLALRPLLKDALKDEQSSLTAFLPRCADVWRALHELETAKKSPPIPMRIVVDDSFKNAGGGASSQGAYANPNIPQFLEAIAKRAAESKVPPDQWVEIRLVKGGDDATGNLMRDETGQLVSVAGTQSAMSQGFIDFLEQRLQSLQPVKK